MVRLRLSCSDLVPGIGQAPKILSCPNAVLLVVFATGCIPQDRECKMWVSTLMNEHLIKVIFPDFESLRSPVTFLFKTTSFGVFLFLFSLLTVVLYLVRQVNDWLHFAQ